MFRHSIIGLFDFNCNQSSKCIKLALNACQGLSELKAHWLGFTVESQMFKWLFFRIPLTLRGFHSSDAAKRRTMAKSLINNCYSAKSILYKSNSINILHVTSPRERRKDWRRRTLVVCIHTILICCDKNGNE